MLHMTSLVSALGMSEPSFLPSLDIFVQMKHFEINQSYLRVPAFLISPYIAPNTLISNQGTMYAENSAYTHTSILHFLQNLWNLKGLNNRVQWAKTFEYVFEEELRDDCLEKLPSPRWIGGSLGPQPAPFKLLNQEESYYLAWKAAQTAG